ncbi:MAG: hypothetical protein OIF32_01005 [Campylobacterales bacterium]|nr:hypothetical protein [Campylobacterales bacterium]
MKNLAVVITVIILGAGIFFFMSNSGSDSETNSPSYNKKTDLTISGVPFHQAKNDATGNTPPPPPVIKR